MGGVLTVTTTWVDNEVPPTGPVAVTWNVVEAERAFVV